MNTTSTVGNTAGKNAFTKSVKYESNVCTVNSKYEVIKRNQFFRFRIVLYLLMEA